MSVSGQIVKYADLQAASDSRYLTMKYNMVIKCNCYFCVSSIRYWYCFEVILDVSDTEPFCENKNFELELSFPRVPFLHVHLSHAIFHSFFQNPQGLLFRQCQHSRTRLCKFCLNRLLDYTLLP